MPPRRPRHPPAPRPAPSDEEPLGGLRLSEPGERLRAAERLREVLLAKVARRKAALERAERAGRDAAASIANQVAPKMQAVRAFDQEIHELLEALATDRSRPQHERSAIRRVHQDLQRRGVLSARTPQGAPASARRRHAADEDEDDDDGPWGPRQDAASAARPPDSEHGGLRSLFRRLVEAFHPDKVQDAQEKEARTEAMKDITEAYRRGDLARLLEVEQRWLQRVGATEAAGARSGDPADLEQRYLELERSNDELRAQVRQLERAARAQRKSPQGTLARNLKRVRQHGYKEADLPIVRDVTVAAEELRGLRDFVVAFRDRAVGLTMFLRGPLTRDPRADDYDDFLDAVTELARQMMQAERARAQHPAQPDPPRRGGRRKRRG